MKNNLLVVILLLSCNTLIGQNTTCFKKTNTDWAIRMLVGTYADNRNFTQALALLNLLPNTPENNEFVTIYTTLNPKLQPSTYTYNSLGWLTARNTPDAGTTQYTYYVGGGITAQVETETDALLASQSKKRVYTYDRLGRKTQQHVTDLSGQTEVILLEKQWYYHTPLPAADPLIHPDATAPIADQGKLLGQLSYANTYNNFGKLTARYYYCYNNPEARLSREVQQLSTAPITATGNKGNVFTIDYPSYNLQGSLKQEQIYQNGNVFLLQYLYEYDAYNRIAATYYDVTNNPANKIKLASYAYTDATGLVRKTTYFSPEGCPNTPIDTIGYQYDIRNRLTNIGSKLFEQKLYYDANLPQNNGTSPTADLCYNGNINATLVKYKLANAGVSPTNIFNTRPSTAYGYTYDGLNRLTAAFGRVLITGVTDPLMLKADENTTYDKIGNITTLSRYPLSPDLQTLTYTYPAANNNNKLSSVSSTISGTTKPYRLYTYDQNGSQTIDQQNNDNNNSYETSMATTYGRSNLPFAIGQQNGDQIGYYYSPTDARYAKVYPLNGTANAELYLRDAYGKELAVYNTATEQYTAYAYGTNRIAHFNVCLCSTDAAGNPAPIATRFSFYNYDHLGNTRVTYTSKCSAGTVYLTTQTALDYYPYGKELRAYNSGGEKYKSTTNERDLETNYDFRNARSSAADVVRFNTIDPLAAQFVSWSPYSYVMGNPVRVIDPTGLYGEGYDVYVDGDKVSSHAEKSFWGRQQGLYEAEKKQPHQIRINGVSPQNGKTVPIAIILNNFIDTDVDLPMPAMSNDVVIHRTVKPIIIDWTTPQSNTDAAMASIGIGGAAGVTLSASLQIVDICKGNDQGLYFYAPVRPISGEMGLGWSAPGVSVMAGGIDFNWAEGRKLNRGTFAGFSTLVSFTAGEGASSGITYIRSCTEGACPYFFGGTTLYSGYLPTSSIGIPWPSPVGGFVGMSESKLIYSFPNRK